MAITRTPIAEATDDQIRDFCELQQLDISGAKTRAALLAILGPAWEHDFIPIQKTDAPVGAEEEADAAAHAGQTQRVTAPTGQIVGGVGANDPKVRVKVGNTTFPGGKDPVPCAVNGRTIVVQRNMEVDLPYRFFLVLENAIRQEVDQDISNGEITVSDVTPYPLSVLGRPSAAEIAEWHERTDEQLMPA